MKRIGIISENYQNDTCAFKAFLTPQYEGKIEFVPLYKGQDSAPPINKVIRTMPGDISKYKLDAVLCMRDLDKEAERVIKNQWYKSIQKGIAIKSIFFLAVMELEALILSDIEKFNDFYGIKGNYDKDPKLEEKPKEHLKARTEKPKAKKQKSNTIKTIVSTFLHNSVSIQSIKNIKKTTVFKPLLTVLKPNLK
jgi:neutral trehalase